MLILPMAVVTLIQEGFFNLACDVIPRNPPGEKKVNKHPLPGARREAFLGCAANYVLHKPFPGKTQKTRGTKKRRREKKRTERGIKNKRNIQSRYAEGYFGNICERIGERPNCRAVESIM
ncbi:hypothetical protein TNCT_118791 [Trichonephila clavata]|uniref:Uncharacterized protein n=1 Tax=Trichonephila clavata TaxID=2740835 RepID=A0A8X6J6W1_TRICU|nr:hypothetical protein TNCT_118791 [Trichonephila clavata]